MPPSLMLFGVCVCVYFGQWKGQQPDVEGELNLQMLEVAEHVHFLNGS